MARNLDIYQILSPAQITAITEPTPASDRERRQGPGGRRLDYVSIGWVIDKLNAVFAFDWSNEVGTPVIGDDQIYVPVRLIVNVRDAEGRLVSTIVKSQVGVDDIRRRDGEPAQLGNAVKAAISDGIKKCASLLGIAADVYGGESDQRRPTAAPAARRPPAPAPAPAPAAAAPRPDPLAGVAIPETSAAAQELLWKMAQERLGLTRAEARTILKEAGYSGKNLPEQFVEMWRRLEALSPGPSPAKRERGEDSRET